MNGVETCTGIHNKCMRLCGNFTKNHTLELTEMVKIIVITSPTPPNFFRSFASVLLTAESAILNQGQFFLLPAQKFCPQSTVYKTLYIIQYRKISNHILGFTKLEINRGRIWVVRSNFACLVCGLVRHVRRKNSTCLVAAPCTILKWRTVVKKERVRVATEFAVNQWRK